MSRKSKPPVLDYGKPEPRPETQELVVLTSASPVFTFMGGFSLLLLMSGAWRISAFCSALGLLCAALGIRRCQTSGMSVRRIALLLMAVIDTVLLITAILQRT